MKGDKNNVYRLLRIARDLKVKEVSDYLRVSSAYINAIESGQREPSVRLISRYAEVLRVDVNTIFYFRNPDNHSDKFTVFLKQILERLIELDDA